MKSGDCARKSVSFTCFMPLTDPPSTSAVKFLAPSINPLAQARNSASVLPLPSAVEHSAFRTGTNNTLPFATVHLVRVAEANTSPDGFVVVVKVPTKKKTGPDCRRPHWAPVSSSVGLVGFGIERTYCQWAADHWPYVFPV